MPRETRFDIAVASEVMAMLGLATQTCTTCARASAAIIVGDEHEEAAGHRRTTWASPAR